METANRMERLFAGGEKGRGLALLGWAGVTVFAVVAAFASWQFAGARQGIHPARPVTQEAGDLTASIRPAPARSALGTVTTVPVPLPGDPVVTKEEFERLNQDVKELRRMVGRVDVSTDVLARRLANLEDATNNLATGSVTRPVQSLVPIAPNQTQPIPTSEYPPRPQAALPQPAQAIAPVTQLPVRAQTQTQLAAPVMPPSSPQAVQRPPIAVATPPIATAAVPTSPTSAQPLPADAPPLPGQTTIVAKTPAPRPPDKAANERPAVDRAAIERMLLENSAALDPTGRPMLPNALLAPPAALQKPPAVPVAPAQVQAVPIAVPPQPAPVKTPPDAKLPDAVTTASIMPKPAVGPDTPKPAESPAPAVATAPPVPDKAAEKPEAASEAPAATFAVDLGGFHSIAQVRKAWSDLEAKQAKLAKLMKPLARLAESPDGIEIRLLAGPFQSEAAAQAACGQLKSSGPRCGPALYQGEPLAKR
ncbi:MAG: SPOR domain-containing protein [Ancalomicrobiaceae bacterium]|nr:SPOR domain-containing protein [Ancalomicrobiaceae bacterium]